MANIKVMIDGKEYTQEQFWKDLARMLDAIRKRKNKHVVKRMVNISCKDVECRDCPLTVCIESCGDLESKYFACFKDVYEWTQKHPLQTNADKLIEIFGEDVLPHINLIDSKEYWLNEEYKDPKGEKEND